MEGYSVCIDGHGEEYLVPTAEGTKKQRSLRMKHLLKSGGLKYPPTHTLDQYRGKDATQNIPKIRKYIDEFDTLSAYSLYLWSRGNASQKTTVATNIIVELLLKGYSAMFILMADLLVKLPRETFESGTESEEITKLRNTDFLVIDDAFDTGKMTVYKSGYQLGFLDTFLRYRLEVARKPVCFTSNIPIAEIGKKWTVSIQSLVERHVPTPMEFRDYLTDFSTQGIW